MALPAEQLSRSQSGVGLSTLRAMRPLVIATVLAVAACTPRAPTPSAGPAPTAGTPVNTAVPAGGAQLPAGARGFGAALSGGRPLALATVLTAPDVWSGKEVVVDGKVRANCTRKGCWMELASALEKEAPG